MKNVLLIVITLLTVSCAAQRDFKNLTERNGKIGIGTNAPDEMLTVKGKIHTQEVIVDLNGAVAPDYVFEYYVYGKSLLNPDYQPFSLEKLEAFIVEHKHLPKIPSASEIDQNGLSLKEMNLLLLEKVEELTLYTIQQQKEIDALKKSVKQLSSQ